MADINFYVYGTPNQAFTEKFATGISTNPTTNVASGGSMYIPAESETTAEVLYYGSIEVPNLAGNIYNVIPTKITVIESSTSYLTSKTWTPGATNGFQRYGDSDNNTNQYMSWRTDDTGTQYLTTGHSLDVWATGLYVDILESGLTEGGVSGGQKRWTELEDDGPYNLNTDKYTLHYYYDAPTALHWSKGGKIGFREVDTSAGDSAYHP
tara:strand:+ start:149 stop:775 length:627 start_codon:yes stop_codon:yes gene_type:complete